MPDRTINFGADATDAAYALGDDDPTGGGNFVVAEDLAGQTRLLEWVPAQSTFAVRGTVDLNGNDLSGVGSATVDTVNATAELGNPTYPTLSDVPTTLPEGTQVYIEDENAIYVEDGT